MYPICCPECGLINHYDDVTFPECAQCQTDLVRCSSCRYHEGSGCTNTRAYESYTEDGQAAKDCPYFHSRQEVRGSRMIAQLSAPIWVSLLLSFIFFMVLFGGLFIDAKSRYFVGSPLQVEMSIPQSALVGRQFAVTVRVTNRLTDQPSSRYYFVLNDNFFRNIHWGTPLPRAERIDASHHRLFFEYDPLPPGGQRIMQFSFIPYLGGEAPFIAQVYSPGNQLRYQDGQNIQITGGNARVE